MIIHGDNMTVLKTYPDNYFHAVLTDPPYGLSFMGKRWDYDVPSVELWKEVLRVLKPGGHMLCACGTRTQHRMAVNIEDAGFEIRDIICWHYASGFPKSLDISAAIDKHLGAEREVIGKDMSKWRDAKNYEGGKYSEMRESDYESKCTITTPASPEAKQFSGFGSNLKPATEMFTLCRKPLSEPTIAGNVLKHGTGGINISACRIMTDDKIVFKHTDKTSRSAGIQGNVSDSRNGEVWENSQGRFPANVVFSCDCEGPHEKGCPVGELDRQSGVRKSGNRNGHRNMPKTKNAYGSFDLQDEQPSMGDSGFASRFFYVAKASKSERNKGLEGFEKKAKRIVNNQNCKQCVQCQRKYPNSTEACDCGGELETVEVLNKDVANNHPTVKPVTLMRYLCRLITPPKGIILDPFNGSGSTGVAAALEWFEYVGIEQEEDYTRISEARQPPKDLFHD